MDDKSQIIRSIELFPVCFAISNRAFSPRSWLRTTITTWAPNLAKLVAVSFPIPELLPVIMQTFPFISLKHTRPTKSIINKSDLSSNTFMFFIQAQFLIKKELFGLEWFKQAR
jgi:hypothetical protein